MYVRLAVATLATLIGLGGAAQADVYSSAPTYGGAASIGGRITCRIFNGGSVAVTITQRRIYANTNAIVPLTSDTCNVPLGPAQYCAFAAGPLANLALSCRVIATGTTTNLRGVAEVVTQFNAILNALPMQK